MQSEFFSPWHVCKGYCRGGTVFEDGACVPKADPDNPESCLPAYSPELVCPSEGKHANPREFLDNATGLLRNLNLLPVIKHFNE